MFYPTHLSRCTKRNKREEPVKQSTACNGCWNLHTCSVHIKPLEVSGAWRWYGDTCQLNGFLGTGLLPVFWVFPDVTLRFTLQPEEHSHPGSRGGESAIWLPKSLGSSVDRNTFELFSRRFEESFRISGCINGKFSPPPPLILGFRLRIFLIFLFSISGLFLSPHLPIYLLPCL